MPKRERKHKPVKAWADLSLNGGKIDPMFLGTSVEWAKAQDGIPLRVIVYPCPKRVLLDKTLLPGERWDWIGEVSVAIGGDATNKTLHVMVWQED
jgi:hypothetical protein